MKCPLLNVSVSASSLFTAEAYSSLLGLWSILQWDQRHHILPVGLHHWTYSSYKSAKHAFISVPLSESEPSISVNLSSVSLPTRSTIAHQLIRRGSPSCVAASYRSSLGCAQRAGWRRANLTCSPLTDRRDDPCHTEAEGGEENGSVWGVVGATVGL